MSSNDRLLKALKRQPVDKTPVWIMRQAGRYLPEYRDLRKKAKTFMDFCKNPELCCQATLQPLARYDLDASIIFSDILTIPDAMGLGLEFLENKGPVFNNPIKTEKEIDLLPNIDPHDKLNYVMQAIELTKKDLKVPLFGFAGSPFTVTTYMIEGQTSKQFNKVRGFLYKNPLYMHKLLEKVTINTINYLDAQIKAGADAIMVFDTWGGILSEEKYFEFSLKYMENIVFNLKQKNKNVPVILFTKNGGKHTPAIAETNCDAIGLDWTADLFKIKSLVGDKVCLQGNLDPCVLLADEKTIREETTKILDVFKGEPGHIFNLGHGIIPEIPPENVNILLDTIKNYTITN